MSTHSNHPFHLVNFSSWPLTGALGAMIMVSGLVKWFHQFNMNLFLVGLLITIMTMIQWWRDVMREGTFQGLHTYTESLFLRIAVRLRLDNFCFLILIRWFG